MATPWTPSGLLSCSLQSPCGRSSRPHQPPASLYLAARSAPPKLGEGVRAAASNTATATLERFLLLRTAPPPHKAGATRGERDFRTAVIHGALCPIPRACNASTAHVNMEVEGPLVSGGNGGLCQQIAPSRAASRGPQTQTIPGRSAVGSRRMPRAQRSRPRARPRPAPVPRLGVGHDAAAGAARRAAGEHFSGAVEGAVDLRADCACTMVPAGGTCGRAILGGSTSRTGHTT